MLDNLINFVSHVGHLGYMVIFIIVAVECQAVAGPGARRAWWHGP